MRPKAPEAKRTVRRRGVEDGRSGGALLPSESRRPTPPAPTEAREHFDRVVRVSDAFFREEADAISRACRAMAGRFRAGGRLIVFGSGAALSDAYHVAVEFVHPVLVGRLALPALALERDFVRNLRLLLRPADIVVGISADGNDQEAVRALRAARARQALTLVLCGDDGGAMLRGGGDHVFRVPDGDPTVVQEVHETLYHILWELVHVFLEREGPL